MALQLAMIHRLHPSAFSFFNNSPLLQSPSLETSSSSTSATNDESPLPLWTTGRGEDDASGRRLPDGIFNGYPVYYHEVDNNENGDKNSTDYGNYYYSTVHCVGETFDHERRGRSNTTNLQLSLNFDTEDESWKYRSCHFKLLCLDMETREYVIFQNSKESNFFSGHGVSIGGINLKWGLSEVPRMKWFPTIIRFPSQTTNFTQEAKRRQRQPLQGFYTLPSNVVLIPYHSFAAFNPGHLVWDDFLPIYTLLSMFFPQQNGVPVLYDTMERLLREGGSGEVTTKIGTSRQADVMDLLLLRYKLPGDRPGLWASCDWQHDKSIECTKMLDKFKSLMLRNDRSKIVHQREVELELFESKSKLFPSPFSSSRPKSNLVCAKNGLAGIGALTDHGTRKIHGWDPFVREFIAASNLFSLSVTPCLIDTLTSPHLHHPGLYHKS